MDTKKIIRYTIFTGLWLTLLIPFYVASNMFFPYITGKNFAFRIIVEIIFGLWVYLAYLDEKYRPKFSWIIVSIAVFVFVMAIADAHAVNAPKAFMSNFERMDGWVTLIHMFLYALVFASMVKAEKTFLWFFRTSVVLSVPMAIMAIHESIVGGSNSAMTTLGNTIYVAVYFLFNFFFALILLYKDVIAKSAGTMKSVFSSWLTYGYLIIAILCAWGIWATATRGVVLGLIGGLIMTALIIVIFEKKNKLMKQLSVSLLVLIAIILGGFFAIKNTQFVKKHSTLESFAVISWSSINGQGQARQLIWPLAIKGFEEKPILGWGQEGFNYVFNQYYNPQLYSQEQWFDRAHDEPLDMLVAGGALGLLAWLSLFVAAIYVLWKKRNAIGVTDAALLVGLLAGYFFQGLFVFDNLISYFFFYTVLAYIYSQDTAHRDMAPEVPNTKKISPNKDIANYVIAPVLIIAIGLSLWYFTARPIEANLDLIAAMQQQANGPAQNLQLFQNAIALNTFGSPEIREQLVSITPQIAESNADATVKQGFADFTYTQMQDQLAATPMDARYQLFMGTFLDNMQQYSLALPYLQAAVKLSPTKQTIISELIKCEEYLGQNTQALADAKREYELDTADTAAQSDYVAALVVNGEESMAEQLFGNAILTNDQNVTQSYLILASNDLAASNTPAAIAEVQKAITLNASFKTQGQSIITGIKNGSVQ